MELARNRRLAAIFALLGFAAPYVPRLFGFPRVPYSCFGVRYGDSQCAGFALGAMAMAGIFAMLGAPGTGTGATNRTHWIRVSAVGLGWVAWVVLIPVP